MSSINEGQEKSRQIQDKHKKYAQIEKEARISELNRTKRTIAMGLSRDLMMLDIFDRIEYLQKEGE